MLARVLSAKAAHPDAYAWYVLASVLDLCLTYAVIFRLDGREVNIIASTAIEIAGFWGLIGLKIATMLVVISVCQVLASRRPPVSRSLAHWSVVISAIPVVVAALQLAAMR